MDTIRRFLSHSKNVGVLLILLASLGCGSGTAVLATSDPATTACQPGSAQILVGDGFLKPTCGCIGTNESDRVYLAPGNLICHLATSNTRVFFHLWGTQIPHQIVSIGSSSFLSSPVMDLKVTPQLSSFVVSFPSPAATYEFREIYTGIVGRFIVP
ncbi:MAG: hypothetical protein ABI041_04745 [Bdellovibrionia bacterium]